jgi:hypothetical protein
MSEYKDATGKVHRIIQSTRSTGEDEPKERIVEELHRIFSHK